MNSGNAASRRVVITGAGSGIGAAVARVMAEAGWRVAAINRDLARAEAVVTALGDGRVAVAADVGSESEMVAAFARIADRFGGVDGLACAGIADSTPLLELTPGPERFEAIHRVNVIGVFLALREAVKLMANGARICTVSSVAGLRGGGVFGTAAYAASKGGVLALTKTAARALAGRRIAVNCVVPGPVQTPMLEPHWARSDDRERVTRMIPLGRPAASRRNRRCRRMAAVARGELHHRFDHGRGRRHRDVLTRRGAARILRFDACKLKGTYADDHSHPEQPRAEPRTRQFCTAALSQQLRL